MVSTVPVRSDPSEPVLNRPICHGDGDDNFQDACPICREPYNPIDAPYVTNCNHEYHFHCIASWFRIKKQCPLCKEHLVSFRELEEVVDISLEKKESTMPGLLHFRGLNRRDQFQIEHPMGKSNNSVLVYKANYCSVVKEAMDNSKTQHISVVAVKCISHNQPQAVQELTRDVYRSFLIPYHRNIIGITKEFNYNGHYCVVFPHVGHSLRSLMHARFSKGFPEECIVVALKETLNALRFIHQNHNRHSEISAGNIFFTGKEIKLAFSASIYDGEEQNQCSSSSPSLPLYQPIGSNCKWAAAPGYYPLKVDTPYTESWMIGITALELAYGGLWVSSRKELLRKLYQIVSNDYLPDSWIDKKEKGIKMLRSFLFRERNFSRAFRKMIIDCLSWHPTNRPTVEELLAYEVFKKCNDMNYFCRIIGE